MSERKRQKTKLALVLMVAMHANLLLAQTAPLEAPALPEKALFPPEQVATTWQMLPGESVESLAALFYPKNKKMQRRFVAKTLQLSRDIQPSLEAATVSNQVSLIVIPDIKLLSNQSGTIKPAASKNTNQQAKLQMSDGSKDAAMFVSAKMQAEYDGLVKRNRFLKQELEKLNAKLVQLQPVSVALMTEAARALSRAPEPSAEPSSQTAPKPAVALIKQNNQSQPGPVSASQATVDYAQAKQSTFISQYLLVPILPGLLVIGFLVGLVIYTRKQAKKLYLASAGNFDPLEKKVLIDEGGQAGRVVSSVHDVDFSLTQSEYAGRMSVVDLGNDESLDYKEEGELALEHARIYVSIERVDEAVALLKAQIESTPKASLHHWLYLLDIYRDTNQKEAFLQYARQLHQSFNVMIPLWENTPVPMVIASSLEEFPHIVEQLTTLWADNEKTAETIVYIDDLLTDNRGSDRTGFGMEVFQELILLRDLLNGREKLTESD